MRMIHKPLTRLQIENFQAIRSIDIPFNRDGLYWVRGQNNIGKSALLKAIGALLTNVSNNKYKAFLRDNTHTFRIKAYFEDDWIVLSRGSQDYYEWSIYGGETGRVDKTGGSVPIELEEYFDLYYEPEKTKRYLNITSTDDPLLFVSTTGGDNNRLLQKALGTEVLMSATKEADKLKRNATKEVKTIETLKLEEEERLQPLLNTKMKLNEEKEYLDRLNRILTAEYGVYELGVEMIQGLDELTLLATYLTDIVVIEREFKQSRIDSELSDYNILKEHKETLETKQLLESGLSKLADIHTDDLAGVQHDLEDIKYLTEHVSLAKEFDQLKAQYDQLLDVSVEDKDEIDTLLTDKQLIAKHQTDWGNLIELHDEYAQVEERLEDLNKDYEMAREALGVCPYCGSVLDSQHHKGGHTHE